MSLSKSNNYSIIDVDKTCAKSNVNQNEKPLANSRRYEIKKISDLKKEHTNQNNTIYGDDRQFRHRSHVSTDAVPKARYKSYDYLPVRRPSMDRYRNNPCTRRDVYNDYSDSGGDVQEDSHEALHKFRKSYSYGGAKGFSSNDELDLSCNYDMDPNPSSDSSRRYQYRPEKIIENHSDYHRNSRHNNFENRKYGANSWNYDSMNNFPESTRYSRYSPTTSKFCRSPGGPKLKHGLRGTSYPSYLNNNRSDASPRKLHTTQLASDIRNSRYTDINNDNYSSHRKEVPNRNLLSLKSTYRKNENVPHSGTRLESHRQQLDKYCTGRSRGARFDESNNCDNLRRNNAMTINRSSKTFRTNLPPSPKYSTTRKKYGDIKSSVNGKYINKEKFTTPRRSQMFSRDPTSDNESCYFENCHNTNNEHTYRYHKGIKEMEKDNCLSVSDEPSSSSFVQSQEKPTESMPLSISSPKLNSNIKVLHSTLNRSNCFGDHFNMSSSQTKKPFQTKQPTSRCVHSERSSRHRNGNKHH